MLFQQGPVGSTNRDRKWTRQRHFGDNPLPLICLSSGGLQTDVGPGYSLSPPGSFQTLESSVDVKTDSPMPPRARLVLSTTPRNCYSDVGSKLKAKSKSRSHKKGDSHEPPDT